jgi:hypothetical protein
MRRSKVPRSHQGTGLSLLERDNLIHTLLNRVEGGKLSNLTKKEVKLIRDVGFMEQRKDGTKYIRGQAISPQVAELQIQMLSSEGHNVRNHLHIWTIFNQPNNTVKRKAKERNRWFHTFNTFIL